MSGDEDDGRIVKDGGEEDEDITCSECGCCRQQLPISAHLGRTSANSTPAAYVCLPMSADVTMSFRLACSSALAKCGARDQLECGNSRTLSLQDPDQRGAKSSEGTNARRFVQLNGGSDHEPSCAMAPKLEDARD